MVEGESLLVCLCALFIVLVCLVLQCFVLLLLFRCRVFSWLVELLTADHTISLSFIPTGVSFVGQDVRLWGKLPVLRRNNLAM